MTTPIMPKVCEGNATVLAATNANQESDMSGCWLVSSHRHSRLRKRGHERQAHQPTRNWVFALLGLLLLAIVVFLYATGGKLPGTTNSPTSDIRGQSAQ